MAVSREQLVFDVLANVSRAGTDLTNFGRKVGAASDDVSALAKRLDELSRKSATARVELSGDKDAQAKLDKLDLKLVTLGNKTARPDVTVEGAARAAVEINALDVELDHLSEKSAKAETATTGLSGLGGTGGLGALIAAGVALSPVIATLGVGLGGLGLAALAAGKNSKQFAAELAPLKSDFMGFQKELQPVLLYDFAKAAGVARTVLHEVEPVAAATGKALGVFIGQLGKMFGSGEWQSFFGFMARTAGPDLRMTGKLFIDLANDIPPLLVALQPVATVLLKTADALALAGRAAEQLSGGPLTAMESFGKASQQSIKDSSTGVSGFNQVLDILIGPQSTKSVDNFFHSLHEGFNILTGAEKGALKPTHDSVTALGQWKTVTEQVVTVSGHLGRVTDVTTSKEKVFAGTTQSVIAGLKEQAHQLNITAAQYIHGLTPLENYINATLAERGDLASMNQVLKASGDRIGYKTQKERDSFAATQTYIDQTIKTGNAALAAHKGIQGQIDVLEQAIPRLERVKGKTAAYKQELDLLKGILDKLRREKQINEMVKVTGAGQWSYRQSGVGHAVSPGGAAAGAFIRAGTTATADDVLARVSRGELIVPARMVQAGAVDHLRGSIPGFAGGGIVPSYSGGAAGLGRWTSHNQQATIAAITTGIARAMASAFASMGGFGAGASGGSGGSVEALARRMFPWPAYMWTDFTLVENREAGWNIHARNPSSGAYGLAQFINGPGEYYQYGGNPNTAAGQLAGMFNYIRQRYGNPMAAWGHEMSYGWYDRGGYLPTGLSLALNTTGKPERVGGGNTYHITVNVPPSANQADIGRQIVHSIRMFEARSGAGWRK